MKLGPPLNDAYDAVLQSRLLEPSAYCGGGVSLDVKLTNRFSLNTSLIDLYLSTPSAGSRRNNFSLTTGITTTFGPGLQARPAPASANPWTALW